MGGTQESWPAWPKKEDSMNSLILQSMAFGLLLLWVAGASMRGSLAVVPKTGMGGARGN
jgi:hypothetical protein